GRAVMAGRVVASDGRGGCRGGILRRRSPRLAPLGQCGRGVSPIPAGRLSGEGTDAIAPGDCFAEPAGGPVSVAVTSSRLSPAGLVRSLRNRVPGNAARLRTVCASREV